MVLRFCAKELVYGGVALLCPDLELVFRYPQCWVKDLTSFATPPLNLGAQRDGFVISTTVDEHCWKTNPFVELVMLPFGTAQLSFTCTSRPGRPALL
jgi:hypothetical protein